jgi:hypothetical protein
MRSQRSTDVSWLHDALNSVVAGSPRSGRLLADIRLLRRLDRHLRWNRQVDLRRLRCSEKSEKREPRGKDASKDW